MVKHYFGNVFECKRSTNGKPLKNFTSALDKPRWNANGTVTKSLEGTFTAPIGLQVLDIEYKGVVSVFRELALPALDVRIIEYYQFVMQPVIIYIVVPRSISIMIDSLTPAMRAKMPDIIKEMTRKRMQVTLPLPMYKKLENAKISDAYLSKLAKRLGQPPAAVEDEAELPEGDEFKADGPFIILAYDQKSDTVLGNTICYDAAARSLGKMSRLLKKLRRRDQALINSLLKPGPRQKKTDQRQQLAIEPIETEEQAVAKTVADSNSKRNLNTTGDDDLSGDDGARYSAARATDELGGLNPEVFASRDGSRRGTFSTSSRRRALSVLNSRMRDFESREDIHNRPKKIHIPPIFQVEDELLKRQRLYTLNKSRLIAELQTGALQPK